MAVEIAKSLISNPRVRVRFLDLITEQDLDKRSTRSGWYRIDEYTEQFMVRPDNREAWNLLKKLGYEISTQLYNGGQRFLLPVNAFKVMPIEKTSSQIEVGNGLGSMC